jgi:hypothetical protein
MFFEKDIFGKPLLFTHLLGKYHQKAKVGPYFVLTTHNTRVVNHQTVQYNNPDKYCVCVVVIETRDEIVGAPTWVGARPFFPTEPQKQPEIGSVLFLKHPIRTLQPPKMFSATAMTREMGVEHI